MLVHGTDTAAATKAVQAAGLRKVTTFDKVGVVVATGLPAQVQLVRAQPGVTYVEGNQPIAMTLATSNKATRGEEARNTLTGANGSALDGKGVSVAVIDSGVDPSHPFLQNANGTSAVVKNLKMVCDPLTESFCAPVDAGQLNTDLLSVGGHGMHVNGIVAGRDVTLSDGTKMHGAAPGASLVSISTGAVLFIVGADAALNWVLENHAAPCGAGVSGSHLPADQGDVQLLRTDRGRGVRPQLRDGQDPARAGQGRRRHGLGQRQRRRRRVRRPVQPARQGPDPRHRVGRVVLRPEHRHPRRHRLGLLQPRQGGRPVDLPRHLGAR